MSGPVPHRLGVVLGTATEVGKTWVSAQVLRALREEGFVVAARKPAQSFAPDDPRTDADELADATGETPEAVCPRHRWYEVPMAPPMAADVLGRSPFDLADLIDEVTWPDGVDVGLVESAGGVRSPLASDDLDNVAFAAALMPDVLLLVADAGLGTINAVRLAVDALDPVLDTRDDLRLVVVLNRFDEADDLHRRNREWLAEHDGLSVATAIQDVIVALRPSD